MLWQSAFLLLARGYLVLIQTVPYQLDLLLIITLSRQTLLAVAFVCLLRPRFPSSATQSNMGFLNDHAVASAISFIFVVWLSGKIAVLIKYRKRFHKLVSVH